AGIKKIPIGGGTPIMIVDSLKSVSGPAWGPDGTIVFTGNDGGLAIVPSEGGKPRRVTTPPAGDRHMWPQFMPDGKGIVFTLWHGAIQTAEIASTRLDGKFTPLGLRGVGPRYVDGRLVFANAEGALYSVSFDPASLRAGTEQRPLNEVIEVVNPGASNYAVSANGGLAYVRGALPNQPVIVDESGVLHPLPMEEKTYARPRYSPDGKRLLFDTRGGAFGEIWLYDIGSGTPQRLYAGEDVHQPEWRADGRELAFTARNDTTAEDLFVMPLDGSARPEAVFRKNGDQYDATWTPDGKTLIYLDDDPFPVIATLNFADRKPVSWLEAGANGGTLQGPRASPDGHWIAYWSNRSGRSEVYVRRFPANGGMVQVSSAGGQEPVWSRKGDKLFYRDGEKLMAAAIVTSPEFSVVGRRLLFSQTFVSDGAHTFYDVSPDGKSFIFLKNSARQAQVIVVLNWSDELREKIPSQ
ncbi:MAG: hypothetical protein ABIZ36_14385, partial [Gemmatimonadaceae bacterium]